MQNLSKWKTDKITEEQNLRKKLKAIEEREAKLEIAKMKLERESKVKNTSTHHKDCQTDGHIDVYDSVTTADDETVENMNQVTSESPPTQSPPALNRSQQDLH